MSQVKSPSSSGPAGSHFEGQVGASYLLCMLVGRSREACPARSLIASNSKELPKVTHWITSLCMRMTHPGTPPLLKSRSKGA